MDKVWLVVLAMGLVTYLPRALPVVLLQGMKLPSRLNRFLQFIPVGALGALIFPGIIESTGELSSALAGTCAAFVLAYCRANLMLVVLGAILAVWGWQTL